MKKRGLDLTLLDDVVDDLRQGKALDEKYKDHRHHLPSAKKISCQCFYTSAAFAFSSVFYFQF